MMTITLTPDQEQAIREAIRAGRVASVEEFIEHAIAGLPPTSGIPQALPAGRTIFKQGLGLFGSPEDAALIDEVVPIAYRERLKRAADQLSKVLSWLNQNEEITPIAADYGSAASMKAAASQQGSVVEFPDCLIAGFPSSSI
jgi:hypothetical protein